MKKTMRVVFALGLIVLSLDLFRPKATDNILIGKWGFPGDRFIFQPDGTVEFHTDWMTFKNAADAIFGIEPEDYYLGEWRETNEEWRTITDVLFDYSVREYLMTVEYMDPDVAQFYKSDDE